MSKSFKDISFLTEAWHFFQKEAMLSCNYNNTFCPVSDLTKIGDFTINSNIKQHIEYILKDSATTPASTGLPKIETQSILTQSPASGFDNLNQYALNPEKNTPLCIQVLRWAQEGKLNLN